MSQLIDLDEARLASRIVKEFPEAIKKLDKCRELLYSHMDYLDIAMTVKQIEEAKIMMELHLEVYTKVLKGIKNNDQERS